MSKKPIDPDLHNALSKLASLRKRQQKRTEKLREMAKQRRAGAKVGGIPNEVFDFSSVIDELCDIFQRMEKESK